MKPLDDICASMFHGEEQSSVKGAITKVTLECRGMTMEKMRCETNGLAFYDVVLLGNVGACGT